MKVLATIAALVAVGFAVPASAVPRFHMLDQDLLWVGQATVSVNGEFDASAGIALDPIYQRGAQSAHIINEWDCGNSCYELQWMSAKVSFVDTAYAIGPGSVSGLTAELRVKNLGVWLEGENHFYYEMTSAQEAAVVDRMAADSVWYDWYDFDTQSEWEIGGISARLWDDISIGDQTFSLGLSDFPSPYQGEPDARYVKFSTVVPEPNAALLTTVSLVLVAWRTRKRANL